MLLADRDLAIAAAEAGAAVVRSRYGATLTRFEKGRGDFATAADIEAEQAILNVVRSARPRDAVIGEESGRTGSARARRTWLVDPLCGTVNYAAQTALVAVNVALRNGSDITVAASADPFSRELFWTDGVHAFRRRDGVDARLTPSAGSHLVEVNLDPPFPNSPQLPGCRTARRQPVRRTVPSAGGLYHPGGGLGRGWSAGRIRDRWPPEGQRPLRERDRPVPGRRMHGDRPARTAA